MAEAAAIQLPEGLEAREIVLHQSQYRLALNLTFKAQKGRKYTFTKYLAASREDWGGDATADLGLAIEARQRGFDALLQSHRAAWGELWKADVEIDGDVQAQTAVHSDLYYLLATSTPDTHWPMGACGLTPGYSGHAFWDSDTWIFPADGVMTLSSIATRAAARSCGDRRGTRLVILAHIALTRTGNKKLKRLIESHLSLHGDLVGRDLAFEEIREFLHIL
jgi:trehalose/maltose hydrolase-like predicted phosphorylase